MPVPFHSRSAPAGITLVSYAEGARFERSQRLIETLAGSHGVKRVVSWTKQSLQQDPLYVQHAAAFRMLSNLSRRVREKRPYCTAFKPLALLMTLRDHDGSWVMWTDSSQWNVPTLNHSLMDAAASLEARQIDAVWGTQHCPIKGVGANGRDQPRNRWLPAVRGAKRFALVSPHAIEVWLPNATDLASRRRFLAAKHILATHVFVKSTAANRAIAATWLRMAVEHPAAFCDCNQDQAALSLLVYNENLPRVDYCGPFSSDRQGPVESLGRVMTSQTQKAVRIFAHALATGAFEVERHVKSRRLEETHHSCSTPILPFAAPLRASQLPLSMPSDRRILFVLSTYVGNRFHARSLMLTLYSLQLHHPKCKVIIVDKASPTPVSHDVLPGPHVGAVGDAAMAAWFQHGVHIIRLPRETPNKMEYGGYAAGLDFLATSTGTWDKDKFEQFVFMQGSMLLSEPVPRVADEGAEGCEVRAFQLTEWSKGTASVVGSKSSRSRAIAFLQGVGLLTANTSAESRRAVWRTNAANHNAIAASHKGLHQLLVPLNARLPAGGKNVFDHPKAVAKMHTEFLTGVIVKLLAGQRQGGKALKCPPLAWRAPTHVANNTPESGFYKIHGSGFNWILPSDVVLSTLLQLADADQDGRASRAELIAAILRRPGPWSSIWHAACLAFPFGADGAAAQFVLRGPRLLSGRRLALLVARAREQVKSVLDRPDSMEAQGYSSCGRRYDAWFWAEKALMMLDGTPRMARRMAMTGTLPQRINFERTWADPLNDMYAEPFQDEMMMGLLQKGEAFWGVRDGQEPGVGAVHERLRNSGGDVIPTRELHRFAERLADAIFTDSSASAERGLNFLELRRIFRRDGFLSLVVLPMCLIYPSIGYRISSTGAWHLRNSTDPFRTINGYRSRTPLRLQLNDSQLTAFDFTVRLNSTVLPRWVNIAPGIWRMQRWDNINNGKVLQCLVSAGLLYARAALACLRCQLELPAVPGPESSENETHDGSTMVGAEASHVLGEAKRRNSEWEWEGVPVLHRPRPSFTMVVDNN